MNILTAFQDYGLKPKRKTANEWAAPCPGCGGKDRCILWPIHSSGTGGRFHCRQCGLAGDTIDFLRKFGGLNYQTACEKTGKATNNMAGREEPYSKRSQTIPFPARQEKPYLPPAKWIKSASAFLSICQKNEALLCKNAIEKLAAERFIPPDYARKFGLGWHDREEYVNRSEWGLPENKKLRLPKGIVIATRRKTGVLNLTIRRMDNDEPKYWQVAGGARDVPYIPKFKPDLPVFLLESALDAALLCLDYEAGKICNAVALGGTCKSIDDDTKKFINAASLIIASPDKDEAGNKASNQWQQLFPSAWVYRAIGAKDIGEMHKLAMGINGQGIPTAGQWATHAIEFCNHISS